MIERIKLALNIMRGLPTMYKVRVDGGKGVMADDGLKLHACAFSNLPCAITMDETDSLHAESYYDGFNK